MGKLKFGQSYDFEFNFKNIGDAPVSIEFVTGHCGCTIPEEWPKKPIQPGESGTIKITFKENEQKTGPKLSGFDVIADTEPTVTIVQLKGEIVE